jgi:hypothetical protein
LVLPAGIVSTGWPAVRDKARSCGIVYDPWQDGLGRAMLAKRADGVYAAGIGGIVISICRQVGKTYTVGTMIIILCILFPGMKVLWTAHRTRTSDETFKSMQGIVKKKALAAHILAVRRANGQQEIEFVNGSRIMFGARETGFGRGFDDVDVLVFDEAQILSQKALDDMVPSTNVSPNPLILFMGTPPKPTDPSEAFTGMRARALAGTSDDLLYVEVSADQDADPDDRAQWAKGNPSYPARTKEAAILRMRRILGEESFLREGLGIWLDASKSLGVIPMAEWAAANQRSVGVVLQPPQGPAAVGLALTHDRSWASVVWAWQVGGRTAVDVVRAEGTDWVLPYLVQRKARVSTLAVDQGGPAGTMLPALGAAGLPVRVADTASYKAACAGLVDAVKYGRFIHRGDPALDSAAALVRWRNVGEGQVFARKDSGVPIDALEGAALGNWALQPDPKKKEFSIMNLADFTL